MRSLALALLLFPACGRAELASALPWLGGTLPSEPLQYREYDLRLSNRLQDGLPLWGFQCDAGLGGLPLIGQASMSLEWDWQGAQGRQLLYGLRIAPEYFTLYADLAWSDAQTMGDRRVGAAKSLYLGDWQFALNSGALLRGTSTAWENHAAIRSPYLFWFTQLGLDGAWISEGNLKNITPQLYINWVGDISIQAGTTLGNSAPLWSFILSYEIFPSP